jgi:hypothetical protein
MELDFTCISGEILNIINNKKKYDLYIVLVCLAIRELIVKIRKTRVVVNVFIIYLDYIKDYIQCYIDFDLLVHICNNMTYIDVIDNNELLKSSLSCSVSSSSSSSDEFENKITKMINNDSLIANKINNLDIDSNSCMLAKNMFVKIDNDNDGIISALDILLTIDNKIDIVLDDDFTLLAINLLTTKPDEEITFEIFYSNFF